MWGVFDSFSRALLIFVPFGLFCFCIAPSAWASTYLGVGNDDDVPAFCVVSQIVEGFSHEEGGWRGGTAAGDGQGLHGIASYALQFSSPPSTTKGVVGVRPLRMLPHTVGDENYKI